MGRLDTDAILADMMQLKNIPEQKRPLIESLVYRLSSTPGVVAVTLGGSYATGLFTDGSDIDLCLYYFEASPFRIDSIKAIAEAFSVDASPTVTDFYGWGPWVNGGAWIHTEVGRVDFIYRNIDQVRRTIHDAVQGKAEHDYSQQPPYGFYGVSYLAETQITVPLVDPGNEIGKLRSMTAEYPRKLKSRIINESLWSAEFSFYLATSAAISGDSYCTVGCLTRIAAYLTQAIFALNEHYFLTDKRLEKAFQAFSLIPPRYYESLKGILSKAGTTKDELEESVRRMHVLWNAIVSLTNGAYQSRYDLGRDLGKHESA